MLFKATLENLNRRSMNYDIREFQVFTELQTKVNKKELVLALGQNN